MSKEFDIVSTRKTIHDILELDVFEHKGGANFTSLNRQDIENVFDLYDSLIFNKQIRDKLQSSGIVLKFYSKRRLSGAGGVCGEIQVSNADVFRECYIDVAPNVVAYLFREKSNVIKTIMGMECCDRIFCLQLILEHEIIHLLMIIWGYLYKESSSKRFHVYTPHGDLYKCMLQTYFGYTSVDTSLSISDVDMRIHPSPIPTRAYPGMMTNWAASCYLDSLITSLFLGAGSFIRQSILEADTSTIDYSHWEDCELEKEPSHRRSRIFKKICGNGSLIETESQTRDYASRLQTALRETYNSITHDSDAFECRNLRGVLAECIPAIRPLGRYIEYNVSEVYDILTDIFPTLKLCNIPTIIKNPILETTRREIIGDKTMFQMWDYIDPGNEVEGSIPLWEEVNVPVLVFQNGLVPPIKNYGSIKSEEISAEEKIPGEYINIGRVIDGVKKLVSVPKRGRVVKVISKARAFGEYIINDTYRLFAAVRSIGRRPRSIKEWGGGHYIAYIRPETDPNRWYEYDDLGPVWRLTYRGRGNEGSLPKDTFIDMFMSRSELLFYQKVGGENSHFPDADKQKQKPAKTWKGQALSVKMVYRPNEHVMLYAEGDPGSNFIRHVEFFTPKYLTKISEEVYMWRENPQDAEEIFEKIKQFEQIQAPPLNSIMALYDDTTKGGIWGVYPTTNEVNLIATKKSLLASTPLENSCHVGFSGLHNFDIMAGRRSKYGIICDFNKDNVKMLNYVFSFIKASSTRREFVNKMKRFLKDPPDGIIVSTKTRTLQKSGITIINQSNRMEKELSRGESWLGSDISYEFIKNTADGGRILAIAIDILHSSKFESMVCMLNYDGIVVDTVYLSNIPHFLNTSIKKDSFIKTMGYLAGPDTYVVHSPQPPTLTDPLVLKQEVSMGWQIKQDPVGTFWPGVDYPTPQYYG